MAAKKSSPKTAPATPPANRNSDAFNIVKQKDTKWPLLAKLVIGGMLSATTLNSFQEQRRAG
jgi:hypothetical protein